MKLVTGQCDVGSIFGKNSFLPEPATATGIKMVSICILPSKLRGRHLKLWHQGSLRNVVVSLPVPVIREVCSSKGWLGILGANRAYLLHPLFVPLETSDNVSDFLRWLLCSYISLIAHWKTLS